MKLIELLPLIERSTVNVYEKRRYGPPKFIVLINPKKNKGCISDDLLDREIYSISISYNSKFNILLNLGFTKQDMDGFIADKYEELVKEKEGKEDD